MADEKQPTMEDMQAIAESGSQATAGAANKTEAQEAAAKGMRDEAERRGVSLSQKDAEMVAAATIAQLEARGAFDPPPEPVQPPAQPTAPPPPTEPADATAPAATPVQADPTPTPPRKQSWAQRYMGG